MKLGQESQTRRGLIAIFLTIFLDLIGFGMLIPILINIARDLQASPTAAASLGTWYSLGTLASVLVLGRFSDRVGRRPVLMATIALSCLVQMSIGWMSTFELLVVNRILAGICAGNISVAQACIADISKPDKRASNMALIGAAFGGGFAFGPALGAIIARVWPDEPLLVLGLVAAGLNLLNFAAVSRFLPETHPRLGGSASPANQAEQIPRPGSLRRQLAHPKLRPILLLQFLGIFGFVGVETLLPLILKTDYGLETQSVYDVFIVFGLAVLFANGFLARKLLRKWREKTALKVGYLCLGAGTICLMFGTNWWMLLVCSLALIAVGIALVNPSVGSLAAAASGSSAQGSTFGGLQFAGTAARILGPVAMGAAYQWMNGPGGLWVAVGSLLLAGMVLIRLPSDMAR